MLDAVGTLRNLRTNDEVQLLPRHVIGRGAVCQLRLDDPKVSSVHAELIWGGGNWKVRDLGSRNGTFVGGGRIDAGQLVELEPGDELAFAGSASSFALIDAAAPRLLATNDLGELRIASDDVLFIPSDDDPELTVYLDNDGNWMVETDAGTVVADEREPLRAGGRTWQLQLPTRPPDTRTATSDLRLDEIELRFLVSRDEEHIELRLHDGEDIRRVESRAHLALLLTLARLRLTDHERDDLPGPECGWVHREDLARMLAIEPMLLNLWIHRARKQLMEAGVRDSSLVVARRAGGSQVRLGVNRVVVARS
jgi:hypothetical protein